MENRVRHLDGWRGFAILAVLVGHYLTSKGLNFGRLGVELFFVLSGRLMAEILFVRERPLGSFYVRRFTRVYPALFAFACILLGVAVAGLAPDPTGLQTLSVVTLTYNYLLPEIGRTAVLGHIWSLCVEEHMYLLLGLVAFLCRRYAKLRPAPILAVLILLALAIGTVQTAMGWGYYDVYWRSDTRGGSILMGALAFLALRETTAPFLASSVAPIALGVTGVALNLHALPDPLKYSLGTACLAASLALSHRAPRWALGVLEHRFVLIAGTLSYSLYLWQQPFYKEVPGFPERLAVLPLALLAGVLSYRLIEQPARRALNRRFHARPSRIAEEERTAEEIPFAPAPRPL